jgi:hypothetical protein
MAIKSRRGGKRPGAGRKPGAKDAATGEQRASIQSLARSYDKLALATLARVAKSSSSDSAAVSAANALLDRGYGRPPQAVEMTGKNGGPVQVVDLGQLSNEQVDQLERIAEVLAGASGVAGGDKAGEGET